jgi:nitrous oxidase accessory protein NosD
MVLLLGGPALALDLASELARAKPGTVVRLPAGTYGGGVEVPAGVRLRGDGCQKTVIDSRGAAVALRASGKGARIENLSVQNTGTGIEIAEADDVALSRVMILGGSIGVRVHHAVAASVENVIV